MSDDFSKRKIGEFWQAGPDPEDGPNGSWAVYEILPDNRAHCVVTKVGTPTGNSFSIPVGWDDREHNWTKL
jgi:hypothetical protein